MHIGSLLLQVFSDTSFHLVHCLPQYQNLIQSLYKPICWKEEWKIKSNINEKKAVITMIRTLIYFFPALKGIRLTRLRRKETSIYLN